MDAAGGDEEAQKTLMTLLVPLGEGGVAAHR